MNLIQKNYCLGLLSCIGAFMLFAGVALAEGAKTVKFDLDKSYLKWVGSKVTSSHDGKLKLKSATGQIHADNTVAGAFEIDMNSLVVSDIEDPKYNKKLQNHLKADDFFSVESFPAVAFKITKAEPIADAKEGQANMNISGDLTIKGITHPVSFPATVNVVDGKVSASGKASVNRTKYDIKYNSGSFFENLGDKLILDDFSVELNLEGQVA
jgi:polyisoprenoid-binding protein YceI